MHQIKKIATENDLAGTYAIVRSSLNVPVENGVVTNQFRIARALPTLLHLSQAGARIILIAHIGRDPKITLKPVFEVLKGSLDIVWCDANSGEKVKECRDALKDGQVLMLENIRNDARETENDDAFAAELASLGDIFVQDAFAAAHREHTSTVGIAKYLPSYAGINFLMEYEELQHAMKPKHPSLFILGGAKFDTKMPLVEKFLNSYDHVFIGGALAHDFFKAKGLEIGGSLSSDIDLTKSSLIDHPKILLPVDVVVRRGDRSVVVTPECVQSGDVIFDAGPQTINLLSLYAQGAKTILWNGPLGNYEHGYEEATVALAKLVAASDAYSVVGGGDTVASIESLGLSADFGFLSTGGGAMLHFLEHGTMPAIEALKKCP